MEFSGFAPLLGRIPWGWQPLSRRPVNRARANGLAAAVRFGMTARAAGERPARELPMFQFVAALVSVSLIAALGVASIAVGGSAWRAGGDVVEAAPPARPAQGYATRQTL